MIHQPLESVIFNPFKKLERAAKAEGKKFMKNIGDVG